MAHEPAGSLAPANVPEGVARLTGKVASKPRTYRDREGTQHFATLLKLPARDEFSSASTIEVQSRQRLGEVGDVVYVDVRISGTARPFTYTDRASGEQRSGTDVTIRLTVVE